VARYRVRTGQKGELDISNAWIVDRKYRVRNSRRGAFTVRRVRSNKEATRGLLAKSVVWTCLATVIFSAALEVFHGNIAELRDLRQSIMVLLSGVLGYYFGRRNGK
jgi:hypothetical protein